MLGIEMKEAFSIMSRFHERFPSISSYFERQLQNAREIGYVSTLMGRKRFFPDLKSTHIVQREMAERAAINTPIQGTAADIIKRAMVLIDAELHIKNLRAKMLLQVHDELVFEVPSEEIEQMIPLVKKGMESAVLYSADFPIKLHVTLSYAPYWEG